ncbi:MAG: preprotein translocase subunit SecY [Nitrososphaerota archaeon]|nr:preprotein translocase subunit SecY [Nitrososphaerota archaeon]MDG6966715.1 preprotein translocase subunit SecY [Nitrososphaerota archaeon]MDG6979224.1 preprotein translocase subunit SecY [Nitrososphaerota archaeon]MDG7006268.1 preprotein translocase subunit SecY [Nitrososphaerota archaeon]
MVSLRNFVKSVATILPEIPKPIRKPTLTEKFIWTGGALVIYMIMGITPLFHFGNEADQFAYLRLIFASSQGTLTELGIGPIVTAGLILQLLQGSDILRLDLGDSEDRALFGTATKLLTFIVIVVECGAYILGGALGTLQSTQAVVIFFQLFGASVIILLLDEMIQKGWGLGSGISLFILGGVAQTLWWDTLSPFPVTASQGSPAVIFGFVPAFIAALFPGGGGVASVFLRANQFPSLFTFVMTAAVILFITYIEGIRVEVPITSVKYRGFQGVYPIKLMYVSNIPVILVSALTANVSFFTRLLSNYIGTHPPGWMKYLVVYNSQFTPTAGIVYYLTPPNGIQQSAADPVHAVIYAVFLMVLAVLFARIWVEIGGLSSRSVAKNLMNADVQVPGFRRAGLSIEQVLNRYIPPITIIGGLIIGAVAAVGDIFGVFDTGIGLLLGVDIVLQYYQMLVKEQLEEFSPRLAGVLGQI